MPDPGWWEALWPDPAKVLSDVGVTPGMSRDFTGPPHHHLLGEMPQGRCGVP
jgi:hypothetical protein